MSHILTQQSILNNIFPENAIFLFEVGDFYEVFAGQAKYAANLLGTTLTKRQEIPITGFYCSRLDECLARFLNDKKSVVLLEKGDNQQFKIKHYIKNG